MKRGVIGAPPDAVCTDESEQVVVEKIAEKLQHEKFRGDPYRVGEGENPGGRSKEKEKKLLLKS